MIKHAKLLDCTLRDGAYLVDKRFGDDVILGIIEGLVSANIDIIEIGFLQDDGFGAGKTVFKNGVDAGRFVPTNKGRCIFTVLADFSRFSVENLDQNPGNTFDAVRACFFKHERHDAVEFCRRIKEKGYKVFVQPVDILGYSDEEIIELLHEMGSIDPYCVSIVDTFGSMYQEDLERLVYLLDHNLPTECKIGFHSHNNMQMSSALSQAFLRMTFGKREVIVDTTLSGMGRGAGNTPTELVAQYMVSKLGYPYNIDAILDTIDTYMPSIRTRCTWGYSTPLFLAGVYSAHVNNITYLVDKNCIDSKGIRYILNKVGADARKRYHYDLLEKTYIDYLSAEVDDTKDVCSLKNSLAGKEILIIASGSSVVEQKDLVDQYITEHKELITIAVNFVPENYQVDYVFVSNVKRYLYWKNNSNFIGIPKILTSNVEKSQELENSYVVAYKRVIKCGWENMENSTILLLRLLEQLDVKSIALSGFDGYEYDQSKHKNYAQTNLELNKAYEMAVMVNRELTEMLEDYKLTHDKKVPVRFVTRSRFDIFEGTNDNGW